MGGHLKFLLLTLKNYFKGRDKLFFIKTSPEKKDKFILNHFSCGCE